MRGATPRTKPADASRGRPRRRGAPPAAAAALRRSAVRDERRQHVRDDHRQHERQHHLVRRDHHRDRDERRSARGRRDGDGASTVRTLGRRRQVGALVARQVGEAGASRCQESSRYSGITRTSARTGMKFVSPVPARDDVRVQVLGDPGAGRLAEVQPHVQPLGLGRRSSGAPPPRARGRISASYSSAGRSAEVRRRGAAATTSRCDAANGYRFRHTSACGWTTSTSFSRYALGGADGDLAEDAGPLLFAEDVLHPPGGPHPLATRATRSALRRPCPRRLFGLRLLGLIVASLPPSFCLMSSPMVPPARPRRPPTSSAPWSHARACRLRLGRRRRAARPRPCASTG